jgi:hypothetical protein
VVGLTLQSCEFFGFLGFLENINEGRHVKMPTLVNGINGDRHLKMVASVNRLTEARNASASPP